MFKYIQTFMDAGTNLRYSIKYTKYWFNTCSVGSSQSEALTVYMYCRLELCWVVQLTEVHQIADVIVHIKVPMIFISDTYCMKSQIHPFL